MKHFFPASLAALIAIAITVANPWVSGIVPHGTAEAAPLAKKEVPDKSLIADGPGSLGSNEEIRAAARAYVVALQQGDGQAIAASWTAHGVYVDSSGQSFSARDLAIQEFTQPQGDENQTFNVDDLHELAKPGTIHWVTTNMALERGTTTQRVADTGETLKVHYLAVWVKQDKRWLLNYLQETTGLKEKPGQICTCPGDLGELEWMVGLWTTQGAGPVAQLSVSWSEDKKYLMQKFKVELPGQKEFRGEQRIAWDPVQKIIRSWIFRVDGGFAESSWSREGDTWIVKTLGVQVGGAKTSAINLWAPEGPDRCWFKSFRLPEDEISTDGKEQDEVVLQFQRTKG